ncbi:MAG TPA: hypothetical protein VGM80_17040 [Gaiellaceae bacterium]
MSEAEGCWRCGAVMEWRHGTWQCGRCRFKLGCCEGEPQTMDCAAEPAEAGVRAAPPGPPAEAYPK